MRTTKRARKAMRRKLYARIDKAQTHFLISPSGDVVMQLALMLSEANHANEQFKAKGYPERWLQRWELTKYGICA